MADPEQPPRLLLYCSPASHRLAAREGLGGLGYSLIQVSGEAEALARLGEAPAIEAVLVDLSELPGGMPMESALGLARNIRRKSGLPLVFLATAVDKALAEALSGIGHAICLPADCPAGILAANLGPARESEAEKALRESEARYRSLIERSSDIIYELSPDGRFTFVSPSWTEVLGHPVDEVLGKSIADFVHPDDLPACVAWLEGVRIGVKGRVGVREYRARRADGSWRWHSSSVVPAFENGRVASFEGIAKDITDRKEMEDRLRAKSEELDLYFNSALDLLCIADTGGHFLKVNRAWGNKLGYSASDLEGRVFLDFVHPDDLEATLAALATLRNQEEILSFVNRYRSADGSWRWLEWRSKPSGETIYAVARDISDRLAAEERIKALLAEKELILKEVHHRIKNNMTAVSGLLSLQASNSSDPATLAALADTQSRLGSMMVLYDRLYRSENPMAVSVAEYLPALVEEVASYFPAGAHVAIETRADDFVLDSKVIQPLGIIVNELISNVMKYAFAPGQGGRLLVTATEARGRIEIAVEDDGKGIPPTVSLEHSTGFGLTLVKSLAGQLKGEARFEAPTRWEGGTRFVVSFSR